MRVNGSTTSPEKLDALRNAGIEPYLIHLDPELEGEGASAFFQSQCLFLNIPPPRGHEDLRGYHLAQVQSIIEAAQAAPVDWIIFASSTGIYPDVDREVAEADVPPDGAMRLDGPRRTTGDVLHEAERLLMKADGLDTTILRFAGLYGPDREPGRFLAGRDKVSGPSKPINLIHLDDGIGMVEAVLAQDARNEVFNACADAHPTRRAFYTYAAERLGLTPPTFATSDTDSGGKVVSNRKSRQHLGYSYRHPDPMV